MRTGDLRDEVLAIGWIRQLFGTSEFESLELPPLYIMETIASWYSVEMIHVLQENEHHYAIPLTDILSSLSEPEEHTNSRKRRLDDSDESGPNKKRKLNL